MKRLKGYHFQIRDILNPVKSDIKSIKTFDGGFQNEEVHVTFYDKTIWILKTIEGKWQIKSKIHS